MWSVQWWWRWCRIWLSFQRLTDINCWSSDCADECMLCLTKEDSVFLGMKILCEEACESSLLFGNLVKKHVSHLYLLFLTADFIFQFLEIRYVITSHSYSFSPIFIFCFNVHLFLIFRSLSVKDWSSMTIYLLVLKFQNLVYLFVFDIKISYITRELQSVLNPQIGKKTYPKD